MDQWSKDFLFLVTGLLSGLFAAAIEANGKQTVTLRKAVTTCIIYGGMGSMFGMLVYKATRNAFGADAPELILAGGLAVGLRLISREQIKTYLGVIYPGINKGKKRD